MFQKWLRTAALDLGNHGNITHHLKVLYTRATNYTTTLKIWYKNQQSKTLSQHSMHELLHVTSQIKLASSCQDHNAIYRKQYRIIS